jgi:hypothetical protein
VAEVDQLKSRRGFLKRAGAVAALGAVGGAREIHAGASNQNSNLASGSAAGGYHYLIFTDGTDYYAQNGTTGGTGDFAPTADCGSLLNSIFTSLATSTSDTRTNKIYVAFAPGTFTCATQMQIPAGHALELHLVGCGMLISRLVYTGGSDFVVVTGSPVGLPAEEPNTLNLFFQDIGFIYQTGTNQHYIWNLNYVNTLYADSVLLTTQDALTDVATATPGYETLDYGDRPSSAQGVIAAIVHSSAGNMSHFRGCKIVGCAFGLDLSDMDHVEVKGCEFAEISCYGTRPIKFGNGYDSTNIYKYGAALYTYGFEGVDTCLFYQCKTGILLNNKSGQGPTNPNPGDFICYMNNINFFETTFAVTTLSEGFAYIGTMMLGTGGFNCFPFSTATDSPPFSTTPGNQAYVYCERLLSDTKTIYATRFTGSGNHVLSLSANPPIPGTQYQNSYVFPITIYLPAYASAPGTPGTVQVEVSYYAAGLGSSSYTGRNSTELVEGETASGSPRLIVIAVPSGWYFKVITSGVALATASLIPA